MAFQSENEKIPKTYGRDKQKNEGLTTRKHPKPPRSPQTLPKSGNLNLLFKSLLPQIFKSITVGLDACQIAIFRDQKKMNLFKMLDFQRTNFFQKKALETCHPFAQPICENKSFESDHQIPSKYLVQRFSNSDHQLFGEP